MTVYYKKLLNVGLSLMNWVGLDFTQNSLQIQKLICSLVLLGGTWLAAVLDLFGDSNTFRRRIDLVFTVMAITTGLVKVITVICRRRDLRRLIADMNQFWSAENDDDEFEIKTKNCLNTWISGYRFCKISLIMIIVLNNFLVMLTGTMSFTSCITKIISQRLCLIIDAFAFNALAVTVLGGDLFFSSILILLRIQFRILNNRLKSMDYSLQNNEKRHHNHIRRCVIHHNFLLRFVSTLTSDIYGIPFLIHFQVALITISLLLFQCSEIHDNASQKAAYVIYFAVGVSDFFLFYCLPGQLLQDEINETVNSIYQSNIHECFDPKVQKSLLLIMVKSNREITICSGKIVILNFETFTKVCKVMYSVFTALQNINLNTTQ